MGRLTLTTVQGHEQRRCTVLCNKSGQLCDVQLHWMELFWTYWTFYMLVYSPESSPKLLWLWLWTYCDTVAQSFETLLLLHTWGVEHSRDLDLNFVKVP